MPNAEMEPGHLSRMRLLKLIEPKYASERAKGMLIACVSEEETINVHRVLNVLNTAKK